MNQPIISKGEALQILKNDLRKRALERRGAELNDASAERRSEILAEIEEEVQNELKKWETRIDPDVLLH